MAFYDRAAVREVIPEASTALFTLADSYGGKQIVQEWVPHRFVFGGDPGEVGVSGLLRLTVPFDDVCSDVVDGVFLFGERIVVRGDAFGEG